MCGLTKWPSAVKVTTGWPNNYLHYPLRGQANRLSMQTSDARASKTHKEIRKWCVVFPGQRYQRSPRCQPSACRRRLYPPRLRRSVPQRSISGHQRLRPDFPAVGRPQSSSVLHSNGSFHLRAWRPRHCHCLCSGEPFLALLLKFCSFSCPCQTHLL